MCVCVYRSSNREGQGLWVKGHGWVRVRGIYDYGTRTVCQLIVFSHLEEEGPLGGINRRGGGLRLDKLFITAGRRFALFSCVSGRGGDNMW